MNATITPVTGRGEVLERRLVAPWPIASGVVLTWEAIAGTTQALHRRGRPVVRVPYVTDVVRRLPVPARVAVTGLVCAAVADHFGKRRVF